MSDLSISSEHPVLSTSRTYRMQRRAEQVEQTRQRITEAALKLHTTVGPAHTSISQVAEEANVTRLTVYRHFPDLDALYAACLGHWSALNPPPDVGEWVAIEPVGARAERAFDELYRWYEARHDELYPIYRDRSVLPASTRRFIDAQGERIAAAIVPPAKAGAGASLEHRVRAAVTRQLVDFWTWRALTIEGGLASDEAAAAAVAIVVALDD